MIEQILEYAGLGASLLATVITAVIAIKTKSKANTKTAKLENVVELAKIVKKIPELVIEAEAMFPSSETVTYGAQKLAYVLKEIQLECMQKNIKYNKDAFKYEIEKILETPQKKEIVDEKA